MKYGDTLRQWSIPAWSHHNIDYDDIKHFIKENTTPGNGKGVTVPGRGDTEAQELENQLYAILEEQHDRIALFVSSKAGEIKRRLSHAEQQVRHLAARSEVADRRIPVGRLERYGRLEGDILKAGDEIRQLARFSSTQNTAFRKLLKKYKKWTGGVQLEERFRKDVMDGPGGFTRLDLTAPLDKYSTLLHEIRDLFENRVKHRPSSSFSTKPATEVLQRQRAPSTLLQRSIDGASKVDFDTALATVPLGESGTIASYWVHPDNVVELQVLMLQYTRLIPPRSRPGSLSTAPVASREDSPAPPCSTEESSRYDFLVADDLDRFGKEQSALTVSDRERLAGSIPQRARFSARWNSDEDVLITAKLSGMPVQTAAIKRKHLCSFFDNDATFPARRSSVAPNTETMPSVDSSTATLRERLVQEKHIIPLAVTSSKRSRFAGLYNEDQSVLLATLDTEVATRSTIEETDGAAEFPFAIVQVREEGKATSELLKTLDHSHLVERIRGFSLEYHAVWQTWHRSSNVAPPFWVPMLSTDIRKLPPPLMRRATGAGKDGLSSSSTTQASTSTGSIAGGITDSTTAVDVTPSSAMDVPDQLQHPPASAFRKKRHRPYPLPRIETQKYWSEYDHPEGGSDNGDAYVLYIDPNGQSAFSALCDKVSRIFRSKRSDAESPLLPSPATPDEESSSDEGAALSGRRASQHRKSYGAVSRGAKYELQTGGREQYSGLPHTTIVCLVASLIILVVAYILAATGRHKYIRAVDGGILFAVISSLIFAVAGVALLFRTRGTSWVGWITAIGNLIIDAVGSGGLLAWLLS